MKTQARSLEDIIFDTVLTERGQMSSMNLSNGIRNQLLQEDSAIHDWYRFVLSFPPHIVRDYLARFGINSGMTVLDPFCGTGTTLLECKKAGINSIGIEAHPMAHFASYVKTDWSPNPHNLLSHSEEVAEESIFILRKDGIVDNQILEMEQGSSIILRELPQNAYKLLLKDSISPLPLHKALVLLECINKHYNKNFSSHEKLALAKVLVETSGNLRFGPEVGVGRIKRDAPVVTPWLDQVKKMAADLSCVNTDCDTSTEVILSDSRNIGETVRDLKINAVFTSPPYPNEKDYTRTTRLETVLLGFAHTQEDIRIIKKGLIRSNTRNVYKDDDDDVLIEKFPEIQKIAEDIESRREELGKTSGFERMYHRVIKQYFGGMFRHFSGLRNVLVPGALLGYVVGDQASYLRVMIRTGRLLSDIALSLGYELVHIDLFRTRLATATGNQLREEVVILRWPG